MEYSQVGAVEENGGQGEAGLATWNWGEHGDVRMVRIIVVKLKCGV